MSYSDKAYEYAKAQGWTEEDTRLKTYKEIAAACGVKIDASGSSAKDFFYVNIRRKVAKRIWCDERNALLATQGIGLNAKIKTVVGFEGGTAEYDADLDAWIVRRVIV